LNGHAGHTCPVCLKRYLLLLPFHRRDTENNKKITYVKCSVPRKYVHHSYCTRNRFALLNVSTLSSALSPLLDIGLSNCVPSRLIFGYSHRAPASNITEIVSPPGLKVLGKRSEGTTFSETLPGSRHTKRRHLPLSHYSASRTSRTSRMNRYSTYRCGGFRAPIVTVLF
jgi:hypothetical protein